MSSVRRTMAVTIGSESLSIEIVRSRKRCRGQPVSKWLSSEENYSTRERMPLISEAMESLRACVIAFSPPNTVTNCPSVTDNILLPSASI